MKTIIHSSPVQVTTSIPGFRRLNDHLVEALKAGFGGFTTVLFIVIFMNLLSYTVKSNADFRIDNLDLLLAGFGFILQMAGTLLKNFTT